MGVVCDLFVVVGGEVVVTVPRRGPGRGGGRLGDASLGFVWSCPYCVGVSPFVSGWLRSTKLPRSTQHICQPSNSRPVLTRTSGESSSVADRFF